MRIGRTNPGFFSGVRRLGGQIGIFFRRNLGNRGMVAGQDLGETRREAEDEVRTPGPADRAKLVALTYHHDGRTRAGAQAALTRYDRNAAENLARHATGRMWPETQAKLEALAQSGDAETARIAKEALAQEACMRRMYE